MTHFYRRCAGAQNGEPPPLSPPQRRGTRGRENKYFKVSGLRFLQALTPRERYCRFLIACPSEPLSRPRERGWGERADAPAATLGAYLCAVRIEFRLPPKFNPYPAQPATGVLGQSPKRILPTFVRTKVGPRRAGVQIRAFYKSCPAAGDNKLFHERPGGEPYKPRFLKNFPRRRRHQALIKRLRGGWGTGLYFPREIPP